jgi:hypothetical protein
MYTQRSSEREKMRKGARQKAGDILSLAEGKKKKNDAEKQWIKFGACIFDTLPLTLALINSVNNQQSIINYQQSIINYQCAYYNL